MTILDMSTPEAAIAHFRAAMSPGYVDVGFTGVDAGEWANTLIRLPDGNSDINAPFMEAFLATQHAIYVVAAEILHGSADVRKLTADEIQTFQISFKVAGGSSNLLEPIGKAMETIASHSVGKLSQRQVVFLLAGGLLLLSGNYGFKTYTEDRRLIRLAEIASAEKKAELENSRYALQDQMDLTRFVAEEMSKDSDAGAAVVDESMRMNAALLRAIALTGDADVNGVQLTQTEADVLRQNKRRSSDESIIEKMVKVVEINTTDKSRTTVELSGLGPANIRVTFADRLIEDRDLNKLHRSLRDRTSVRVKLEVRRVGAEIRSAEILRVVTPRKTDVSFR